MRLRLSKRIFDWRGKPKHTWLGMINEGMEVAPTELTVRNAMFWLKKRIKLYNATKE